jgi:hypothetical protein
MNHVHAKVKDHHKTLKGAVVVKQRPFKLTSGKVDPWNPRIEHFVQDNAAPKDRCYPTGCPYLESVVSLPYG